MTRSMHMCSSRNCFSIVDNEHDVLCLCSSHCECQVFIGVWQSGIELSTVYVNPGQLLKGGTAPWCVCLAAGHVCQSSLGAPGEFPL